jgi:hypothetical protein
MAPAFKVRAKNMSMCRTRAIVNFVVHPHTEAALTVHLANTVMVTALTNAFGAEEHRPVAASQVHMASTKND